MAGDQEKAFSFETVAVLCAAVMANGGTIGGKHYDLMSARDGKRTASAFQHQFRAVLKRAHEIKDTMGTNDIQPVTPKTGRSRSTAAKSSGKKRGAAKKTEDDDDSEDVLGGADDASPSLKKVKVESGDGNVDADE